MNTFSKNLHRIRHSVGYSQERIAKKLGVLQVTVSNWETGKCEPSISMATRLAEVLGVTVNDLVGMQ